MFKKQRKKRFSYKRLLIFLFLLLTNSLFSQNSQANNLVEITYMSKEYFLNSNFVIEIKINENNKQYKKISENTEFIIDNKALDLLETKNTSVYSGLLIRNTYKLKENGKTTLKPYIKSQKKTIKLNEIYINVKAPILSKDSEFKWIILSNEKLELTDKTYKDEEYLILLAGFFYDDPNTVLESSFITPENSILEASTFYISKAELNKKFKEKFNGESWNFIKAFYWTPLKKGELSMPKVSINVKTKGEKSKNIHVNTNKIFVEENLNPKEKISEEEKTANKSLELALREKKIKANDTKIQNIFTNFAEKKLNANKIAELRRKESRTIFSSKIKEERENLENKLDFNNSFKPYSFILHEIIIITAFVLSFLIILIIFLKKSKKIKKLSFILILIFIPSIISGALYLYFFEKTKHKQAVYAPKNEKASFFIYHIPEKTASILGYIEIGETVFIKQETDKWIYIEKKDGTGGWQKKDNFIILDDNQNNEE